MKKVLLFSLVALGATLMSCKKNYECDCKVGGGEIKIPLNGYKKKDAKAACDQAETTYKITDSGASCSFK